MTVKLTRIRFRGNDGKGNFSAFLDTRLLFCGSNSRIRTGLVSQPFDHRDDLRQGVMDLIGNIAEYCDDGPGPGSAYIKGGCWLTSSPLNLRCAAVGMSGFSNNALDYLGFRCVQDV